MAEVIVVCEGQTEEKFIREIIAPLLRSQQIYVKPVLMGTSKGNFGGALTYERVKVNILRYLKQDAKKIVTTFFDLYALNNKFPAFFETQTINDVYQKVARLEESFKSDIIQDNFSFSKRFIPYIQPYEFEGLLFSDISRLTEIESHWQHFQNDLQSIRQAALSPEHINDGVDTKPSARLKVLSRPNYDKLLHGTLAIESIGIDKLCAECKHFADWYAQLTQLGTA